MANKKPTAGVSSYSMNSLSKDNEKKSAVDEKQELSVEKQGPMSASDWYTLILLLLVNVANYADRYTAATVLDSIRATYDVKSDMTLGLLHTVFILTYMIFSPLFGYLGDRYNRRILMAVGLFAWGGVSLASAFIGPNIPHAFWIFLTLRAFVGIGEASYITISPTIISDLFTGRRRTLVILAYQSMMLIGSGAGYMVASTVLSFRDNWQDCFLVWPPIVFVCMFGLIFMKEPERGLAEGFTDVQATSYWEDIKYLIKVKSYVLCTLGFTSLVFVVGAISFWAPLFATKQIQITRPHDKGAQVGLIFGICVIGGGILGAVMGTGTSKLLKKTKAIGESADALACAIGGLVSGPLLYLTLFGSEYSSYIMWAMIFLSMTFLSVNLVLNTEITLYVLIPTRRATGSGVQILICHLFGDAASPYIVGWIVDVFEGAMRSEGQEPNNLEAFYFRQRALYFTTCICVVGSFFYFICSLYVEQDKDKAKTLAASMSRASTLYKLGGETMEMQPPPLPQKHIKGGIYMLPGNKNSSHNNSGDRLYPSAYGRYSIASSGYSSGLSANSTNYPSNGNKSQSASTDDKVGVRCTDNASSSSSSSDGAV